MAEVSDAFFKLPEDKRLRIINSALEIFSKNEYKRASTDDIAAKAGISKGLLFYYFHNKKELYLYLYQYCEETVLKLVVDTGFYKHTDFFDLMIYCAEKKAALMEKMPFLMDFCLRAFCSEKEEVSEALQRLLRDSTTQLYSNYLKGLDFFKFKEGLCPTEFIKMLTWMTDGYLNEIRRTNRVPSTDELLAEFRKWTDMFRYLTYKEEYATPWPAPCSGKCAATGASLGAAAADKDAVL